MRPQVIAGYERLPFWARTEVRGVERACKSPAFGLSNPVILAMAGWVLFKTCGAAKMRTAQSHFGTSVQCYIAARDHRPLKLFWDREDKDSEKIILSLRRRGISLNL